VSERLPKIELVLPDGDPRTARVMFTDRTADGFRVCVLLSDESELRDALGKLLAHVDRETCTHEETYRGGAIWTFCRQCGRKWADDRGGFEPHEDAPAVAAARVLLNKYGSAS
jgi:hypothetical protein